MFKDWLIKCQHLKCRCFHIKIWIYIFSWKIKQRPTLGLHLFMWRRLSNNFLIYKTSPQLSIVPNILYSILTKSKYILTFVGKTFWSKMQISWYSYLNALVYISKNFGRTFFYIATIPLLHLIFSLIFINI